MSNSREAQAISIAVFEERLRVLRCLNLAYNSWEREDDQKLRDAVQISLSVLSNCLTYAGVSREEAIAVSKAGRSIHDPHCLIAALGPSKMLGTFEPADKSGALAMVVPGISVSSLADNECIVQTETTDGDDKPHDFVVNDLVKFVGDPSPWRMAVIKVEPRRIFCNEVGANNSILSAWFHPSQLEIVKEPKGPVYAERPIGTAIEDSVPHCRKCGAECFNNMDGLPPGYTCLECDNRSAEVDHRVRVAVGPVRVVADGGGSLTEWAEKLRECGPLPTSEDMQKDIDEVRSWRDRPPLLG